MSTHFVFIDSLHTDLIVIQRCSYWNNGAISFINMRSANHGEVVDVVATTPSTAQDVAMQLSRPTICMEKVKEFTGIASSIKS